MRRVLLPFQPPPIILFETRRCCRHERVCVSLAPPSDKGENSRCGLLGPSGRSTELVKHFSSDIVLVTQEGFLGYKWAEEEGWSDSISCKIELGPAAANHPASVAHGRSLAAAAAAALRCERRRCALSGEPSEVLQRADLLGRPGVGE